MVRNPKHLLLHHLHLGLPLGKFSMDLGVFESLKRPFLHRRESCVAVLEFLNHLELKLEFLENKRLPKAIRNITLRLRLTSWPRHLLNDLVLKHLLRLRWTSSSTLLRSRLVPLPQLHLSLGLYSLTTSHLKFSLPLPSSIKASPSRGQMIGC